MGPHKDPAKLPVDDQLKLLRNTVDEIASDVSFQGMRLRSVESQVKIIRTELKDLSKDMRKGFNEMQRAFTKWRNEIFTKIDGSYAKPIFDLQNDNTASLFRQKVQQEEIDKLKVKVFGSATA